MTDRTALEADAVKTCCANVYASDWAKLLLGDSFHPGGLALTTRLGQMLGLDASSTVLDVATGRGASAIYLAQTLGCRVIGVDYSARERRDGARGGPRWWRGAPGQLSAGRCRAICRFATPRWMRRYASAPSAHFRTSRLPPASLRG